MTTKEKIEVMEAFERGEEIEYAHKGREDWFKLRINMWCWDDYDYRIKPKRKKDIQRGLVLYTDVKQAYLTQKY